MKAALADRPPKGDEWLFEVKWDGVRAIAFVEQEEVRLQSRSGLRCERQYPELAVIHHHIAARQAVLDGEIAVLDEKGVSRFHLIQSRIANTDPNTIAHLVRSTPVVYFVFDLLYLDGYDLRGVALAQRRELLEAVVTPGPVLRISEAFPGAGDAMLEAARETGLEGILAKHASSTYESKRSREWLKIKIVGEQEFVIGGFTEPQGDRDHFGALVLGVNEGGKLRWVGNVGTGFDQKTLAALYGRLEPLITRECPFDPASQARPRHDLGKAAADRAGEVRQLDHRPAPPCSRLSRPSQRCRAAPGQAGRSAVPANRPKSRHSRSTAAPSNSPTSRRSSTRTRATPSAMS